MMTWFSQLSVEEVSKEYDFEAQLDLEQSVHYETHSKHAGPQIGLDHYDQTWFPSIFVMLFHPPPQ